MVLNIHLLILLNIKKGKRKDMTMNLNNTVLSHKGILFTHSMNLHLGKFLLPCLSEMSQLPVSPMCSFSCICTHLQFTCLVSNSGSSCNVLFSVLNGIALHLTPLLILS